MVDGDWMRDRTMLRLFRWFYLRHPIWAADYVYAQTVTYGWRWIYGERKWTGRTVSGSNRKAARGCSHG